MALLYHEYYPWQSFVNDTVMGHADGGVSMMFSWDGIDNLLFNDAAHHLEFKRRLDVLHSFGANCTVEHHFFREKDSSVIDDYLTHGDRMVRGRDLAEPVRQAMADHYRPLARTNRVFTTISLSNGGHRLGWKAVFSTATNRKLYSWEKGAEQLLGHFNEMRHHYPGAECLDISGYLERIIQGSNRDLFAAGYGDFIDHRYDYASQLITIKPELVTDGQLLRVGDTYTKVALIQNYPSLDPSWFLGLSQGMGDLHVSQIIMPKDTRKALDVSSDQSDSDEATLGKKGRDVAMTSIKDAANYRAYVTENGLRVFDNAYLVHLHGSDKEAISDDFRKLRNWVHQNDGLVRGDADIQAHLYRVGQVGVGNHTQFAREDHSASISSMMPFTVFSKGVPKPESIRVTSSHQVVGHSPSRLDVGHELVVAKTGAGKDTQMGIEMIETYPFGMDYLICEFGDSYKWIVEGFGGPYTRVDDGITINPLPPIAQCRDGKLPSKVIDGTLEGLSIVLTDSSDDLSMSEQAAGTKVIDLLYKGGRDDSCDPTLPDMLAAFERADFPNEEQAAAAKRMYNNLYNFLDSAAGRAFQGKDNLNLDGSIAGVDLMAVGDKMLKFYLTFIGLRFAQQAFFSLNSVTKILLNELHQPVAVAPAAVGKLVRVLNRMGRKEGGHSGLITQGMNEVKVIDKEVISSSTIRTLLVRDDSWEDIGKELSMPDAAIAIWKSYQNDLQHLPYRQCMRMFNGQYHDLFLTFPQLALDITTTKREDREIRHRVEKETTDIFERLHLFKEKTKEGVAA